MTPGSPNRVLPEVDERDVRLHPPALDEVRARTGMALSLRVGVHRGPLVAGVIGQERVQYDVWGDTVNVAARMESPGEAGRVHVSAAVAEALGPRHLGSAGQATKPSQRRM